jgi:uncharacterized 2Fe-2S/4Fe-4S cluster protein (DUF4445 family)
MALVSRRHREQARAIARAVQYVELAADPRFVNAYTGAMMLPAGIAGSRGPTG